MTIKLNDFVAQKIVEFIHEKSEFSVIICDNTGTIIADSTQELSSRLLGTMIL